MLYIVREDWIDLQKGDIIIVEKINKKLFSIEKEDFKKNVSSNSIEMLVINDIMSVYDAAKEEKEERKGESTRANVQNPVYKRRNHRLTDPGFQ